MQAASSDFLVAHGNRCFSERRLDLIGSPSDKQRLDLSSILEYHSPRQSALTNESAPERRPVHIDYPQMGPHSENGWAATGLSHVAQTYSLGDAHHRTMNRRPVPAKFQALLHCVVE